MDRILAMLVAFCVHRSLYNDSLMQTPSANKHTRPHIALAFPLIVKILLPHCVSLIPPSPTKGAPRDPMVDWLPSATLRHPQKLSIIAGRSLRRLRRYSGHPERFPTIESPTTGPEEFGRAPDRDSMRRKLPWKLPLSGYQLRGIRCIHHAQDRSFGDGQIGVLRNEMGANKRGSCKGVSDLALQWRGGEVISTLEYTPFELIRNPGNLQSVV
ncbi:hypothetical protein BZA05DRAFT_156111 [Tricharina praecox]|uniref:uncharacterized protein n=1 Tax=Tricharina praecox TaxID=43433 RepID=UPI00221EC5D3|nr:uncharacterized protein BZA05DRAFT_156111 [Tricharina praecox]KAI5844707.1 hypothetical protein BZA05DRAFT_156111 [Tricharina praecox]